MAPHRGQGVWGKGDNAAGSAPAPSQVGGHCKNIPTLEYGFLVQVSVLHPACPHPTSQSILPTAPHPTYPHPAARSILPSAVATVGAESHHPLPSDHEVCRAADPDAQRVLRGVR